eukprot:6267886-Heterocapsa_arctica.AAC.1
MASTRPPEGNRRPFTGPRLGRNAEGDALTVDERTEMISEMDVELQANGSLVDWFVRQIYRLRFAGRGMTMRERLVQSNLRVQAYIDPSLVPAPTSRDALAADAPVSAAARKEEGNYEYSVNLCKRLMDCCTKPF